ncbi:FadR/GntR family transcriptional regulator [Lysinibacillus capsici]|uniref:GntR family transcriptional regulator n=1 Tax=Lysinibacillus capsici TaxID=2115968 RepID=A0A2X0YCS3_9BACI|nr:FadR/GntR family transcriptional regulator [Lysinibacillus capsici]MED4552948.1 FadR/GntR family transcriptional regulator [Lysinibacillus capsici]WNN77530.1 FadR/GntR family transcriptional regulator [Lysinibacillus capsici]SPU00120.1 GntR family transcriptional regulator [Lysinibacillus capsici]
MNLSNVTRNTLAKQVSNEIVKLIEKGDVKPGEKLLTELELMEILGVSRPVIREALSSLEALEIINKSPRGGTFVNKRVGSSPFKTMLSINSLNHEALFEARMVLELGFVTVAANKISQVDLDKLALTIKNIEESIEDSYGEQDKEFHRIIALSVDNPILEGMIESLLAAHEEIDNLIKTRDREITVKHHIKIFEALCARDPVQAYLAMWEHLNFVKNKVLKTKQ